MKMIDRNKFFSVFGLGMIGVLFSKIFPFSSIINTKSNVKNVKVKINPLAVKREKIGGKNV